MLHAQRNRNAIYLCEQAAEKLIRAVLTSEKVHAGVRHQLDEMVAAIPDENPLKSRLHALQHLSTYATSYRYTTPTGRIPADPPVADVDAVVKAIERILHDVAKTVRRRARRRRQARSHQLADSLIVTLGSLIDRLGEAGVGEGIPGRVQRVNPRLPALKRVGMR